MADRQKMDIQEIKDMSAYELASMADCVSPDSRNSPGAQMLTWTRDAVIEAWEAGRYASEEASDVHHAIADDAPSVYTYTTWQQFVDLGAWQEEPETGEWPDDLNKVAAIALYRIAERLAAAVHDALCDMAREAEDEDEGDTGTVVGHNTDTGTPCPWSYQPAVRVQPDDRCPDGCETSTIEIHTTAGRPRGQGPPSKSRRGPSDPRAPHRTQGQ